MTDQGVEPIAIVGMAGRFPGAPDVQTLWANVCGGVESVRPLSEDELRSGGANTTEPGFVNAAATMDDFESFDARFFGMSRREAELTDPQHRILLEAVWNVLEHAGHDPASEAGRIGIFGGVAENYYFRYNLQTHPELLSKSGFYPIRLASGREYAILKTAYKLGLTGPAISVMTACSTSAVAAHLAVQSLLAGECDLALAGGAHLFLPGRYGYVYEEDGILSADGHVRAFDADASGTVMASGVAFVALKRLSEAIDDADTIYAVIRGSAINNDGAAKVGFTAPGIEGQTAVIEDALAVADVDAGSIGLVEAHGTGTSLGDPIEIVALTKAYRRQTSARQYCAIGSCKSNIGHLDAAAGVTGMIKAALSLHHECIPPSINFDSPNPQIDFSSSPFYVNTDLRAWKRTSAPRRAAVSSFGFGGTNAHVILEEAPAPVSLPDELTSVPQILTLSAKGPDALDRRAHLLADHLASRPETDLADAAYTLAVGRARLPHRRAVVANERSAAIDLLRRADPQVAVERTSAVAGAEVAFLFTGQGAQYPGMGMGLYRTEPVFMSAIRECAQIVGDVDGSDLIELLYGETGDPAVAGARLMQTAVGQPAIFALQFALTRLWASWGVEPAAMVGHSVGELVAAYLGGVFTLEDALSLATERGHFMQDLPVGAMTAVLAEESAVSPLLDPQVSLAAVNAPEQCVASGPPASIEELERRLAAEAIPFRRLPTDRAFHSPMMEPAVAHLRDHVERMMRGELTVPMVSTVTGTWTTTTDISDPMYWGQHARRTVRFADAVGVLLSDRPGMVLVEIGPGATLASLVREHPGLSPESVVISSLPHRGTEMDDAIHARRALADTWTAGADVDLVAVNGGRRRRIPLPTYPFERERHWIEAGVAGPEATSSSPAAPVPPSAPAASNDAVGLVTADLPGGTTRKERIASVLASTLADLSGLEAASIDAKASFTDLGFDSLFLTQANSQFRKQFRIKFTLGQLFGETPTVEALATRIDMELAPEAMPLPEVATAVPAQVDQVRAAPLSVGNGDPLSADQVGWLVMDQLRIMEEQLDVMRSHIIAPDAESTSTDEAKLP